jgi:hypothetical protein
VAAPIGAVVLLHDDTPELRRPITSRTPTPTAPPPSPEPTSLDTMELRLGTPAPGAPAGWRRWRASDGAFSFAGPVPDAPPEPAFDGSLWEVTIDGSLMTFYVYASDNYLEEDVDTRRSSSRASPTGSRGEVTSGAGRPSSSMDGR